MKKAIVPVLSVLLVVATALGIFFYKRTTDLSDSLSRSEKRIETANIELARSKEAIGVLTSGNGVGAEQVETAREQAALPEKEFEAHPDGPDERIRALEEELEASKNRVSTVEEQLTGKTEELAGLLLETGRLRELIAKKEKMVADNIKEKSDLEREKKIEKSDAEALKKACADLEKELKQQIESREAVIRDLGKKISVTFLDSIVFNSADAGITREGTVILKKTGKILRKISNGRIIISGHTDSYPIKKLYREKYPSNWELSGARAASVARFFQHASGIAPDKLEIRGHSLYRPVAGNETYEGRARNRRVEIMVVPRPAADTSILKSKVSVWPLIKSSSIQMPAVLCNAGQRDQTGA